MKSHPVLLCATLEVNHPFVQDNQLSSHLGHQTNCHSVMVLGFLTLLGFRYKLGSLEHTHHSGKVTNYVTTAPSNERNAAQHSCRVGRATSLQGAGVRREWLYHGKT